MLANNNEYLKEAAESIYMANEDEMMVQRCRAREEAERWERYMQNERTRLEGINESLEQKNESLAQKNEILEQRIVALEQEKESLIVRLEQLEKKLN